MCVGVGVGVGSEGGRPGVLGDLFLFFIIFQVVDLVLVSYVQVSLRCVFFFLLSVFVLCSEEY